jgi:hypothetical protein
MANINLENLQRQLVRAEEKLELAVADEKDATAELIKISKLRSKSRNSVSDAEYRKHSQIQINATEAKNHALEQVRSIKRMIAAAPVRSNTTQGRRSRSRSGSRTRSRSRSRGRGAAESPNRIPNSFEARMALVSGNTRGRDLVYNVESVEADLDQARHEGEPLSPHRRHLKRVKAALRNHLATRKRS